MIMRSWRETWRHIDEAARLAVDAVRAHTGRSVLAIGGIVIGIVTVVMVASVLVNLRNQIALLFRELGSENIFAFHLSGDPYSAPSQREAARRPLDPRLADRIPPLSAHIADVAAQVIVPAVINGQAVVARAGQAQSDTVLLEGASANYFDVVGAEFAAGRPFTELEDRAGAKVAIIGSSLSRALFAGQPSIGREISIVGGRYTVIGELAPRKGGFFGENRQDSVLAIPVGTVRRRIAEADRTVLYLRARPGRREQARAEADIILRRLRGLDPEDEVDFNLSTADQIIRSFDQISARIGLATIALAGVSLLIGGIGIANVMVIGVTERTREIGVRMALGARRRYVLTQFLLEAALLSGLGGVGGVAIALAIGLIVSRVLPGFSAVPPTWALAAGVLSAIAVGVIAGFLPARRAARLDPVEALRYE